MFASPFEFEEGGRLYRCSMQGQPSERMGAWWWFDVAGDAQRYAPFRHEPSDTKQSVQTRIVAYYAALLARRAEPPAPRHTAGRPRGQSVPFGKKPQPAAEDAQDKPSPDGAADNSES